MDAKTVRNIVMSIVKPLKSGKAVSQTGTKAALSDLYPDGFSDQFRLTSPFGFISGLPVGITAFYNALFGSGYESIILGQVHEARPAPAGPGETILYSTDASGNGIQVKITLGADGTIIINAPVKVTVVAPEIDLGGGGLEKLLNGETFQSYFNQHQHVGNLGTPTGPPMTPSDPSHLSSTVKAKK
jgi:phage gp45-like